MATQTSEFVPSGTPIRHFTSADLERDGYALFHLPGILAPEFQALQQAEYDIFVPGENARNKLPRAVAWGSYLNDRFEWSERDSYQLDARFNQEEAGNIRHFQRASLAFLTHPVTERIYRAVFAQWKFARSSREQLYQVQSSLIRYEPTLADAAMPSPNYPHQDAVDGAIVLLGRTANLAGGTSRLYDLDRRPVCEIDMRVGDVLMVRDARLLHQVTPVLMQPGEGWTPTTRAWRNVLLIRFQAVGR